MSQATSSLAPSDSVSQAAPASTPPKRRTRPGKKERQGQSMASSAVPTPGKYPVVFSTGTGEAISDSKVALAPRCLADSLSPFVDAVSLTPRFAEYSAYSGKDEGYLGWWLVSSGLCYTAQRLLWAHEAMGLPRGDFGPVGSTDIKILRSMATALSQVGEMRVDELCQRFILADYPSTLRSIIRSVHRLRDNMSQDDITAVISEMWLPCGSTDPRFDFLVSRCLSDRLRLLTGLAVPISDLADELNMGVGVPEWFEALKPLLQEGGLNQDRFDFLFDAFGTEQDFLNLYGQGPNVVTLEELGLRWAHPARQDLGWALNHKREFSSTADRLLRAVPAMGRFFSLVSSQTLKAEARGSRSQLAYAGGDAPITIVRSRLALTAPELSLFVCFPLELIVESLDQYPTAITTAISVSTRRMEFIQLDALV